ncbi:haloacid dehalogenase-like hydrolase [Vibrio phage 1.081.O._10N.286.52.C2]|nr:haloacid dehalogenase-like hydrolase [Vibrio phage 1.081.O._10N.286.52.C2]
MTDVKPTIILDVDGVLIDWACQLPFFCKKAGIDPVHVLKHYTAPVHVDPCELFGIPDANLAYDLMDRYNLQHGKFMTAYPDAVDEIHKIARDYNLIALTKFGVTTEHWMTRKFNLDTFFPNCFSELITIGFDASKVGYVRKLSTNHDVVAFVDDQIENTDLISNAFANSEMKVVHLNRYDARADVNHMSKLVEFIKG